MIVMVSVQLEGRVLKMVVKRLWRMLGEGGQEGG